MVNLQGFGSGEHPRDVQEGHRRAGMRSLRSTSTTWSRCRPSFRPAVETKSPVILQVSSGARKYANQTHAALYGSGGRRVCQGAGLRPFRRSCCTSITATRFELVQIVHRHGLLVGDDRRLALPPYEENVALTKKVVDYAHQYDVTVEGELGVLAGIEDDVKAEHHTYTQPEEVIDFVSRTGVDSLAISIGTSHGANKFTPEQCTRDAERRSGSAPPAFRYPEGDREDDLPDSPIVLHGSSFGASGSGSHHQQVRRRT